MTQSEDFAWAIAFARWAIFKMVSFLEHLDFCKAVFCTEQHEVICRMYFNMFFGILNFDPKLVFFGAVFCAEQLEMNCRIEFDKLFRILIFDPK